MPEAAQSYFLGRHVRRLHDGRLYVPPAFRRGLKSGGFAAVTHPDWWFVRLTDPQRTDLTGLENATFGVLDIKTNTSWPVPGRVSIYRLDIDRWGRIYLPRALRAKLGDPARVTLSGTGRTINLHGQ